MAVTSKSGIGKEYSLAGHALQLHVDQECGRQSNWWPKIFLRGLDSMSEAENDPRRHRGSGEVRTPRASAPRLKCCGRSIESAGFTKLPLVVPRPSLPAGRRRGARRQDKGPRSGCEAACPDRVSWYEIVACADEFRRWLPSRTWTTYLAPVPFARPPSQVYKGAWRRGVRHQRFLPRHSIVG